MIELVELIIATPRHPSGGLSNQPHLERISVGGHAARRAVLDLERRLVYIEPWNEGCIRVVPVELVREAFLAPRVRLEELGR